MESRAQYKFTLYSSYHLISCQRPLQVRSTFHELYHPVSASTFATIKCPYRRKKVLPQSDHTFTDCPTAEYNGNLRHHGLIIRHSLVRSQCSIDARILHRKITSRPARLCWQIRHSPIYCPLHDGTELISRKTCVHGCEIADGFATGKCDLPVHVTAGEVAVVGGVACCLRGGN